MLRTRAKTVTQQAGTPVSTNPLTPALEIIGLTKHYRGRPNPAISNLVFTVHPGEFHAFIGANGAGKTTTIKSIVGAYAQFKGEIKIFGEDNRKKSSKLKLGYIPEVARFPRGLTLFQYVMSMAVLSGKSLGEAKKISTSLIAQFNLTNLRNSSPNTFSSGQKKKALLAQALIHNPQLIVMDEPAANLDPVARIDFFDTLRGLQKKGVAIVISSHILAELTRYADSVTIIDGGEVKLTGKLNEITYSGEPMYEVETNDSAGLEVFLKSGKYEYVRKEDSNVFRVKAHHNDNLNPLLKRIVEADMHLLTFRRHLEDLDALYERYVLRGSVDTAKTPEKKRAK